jgi:hypothetical protein
MKASDEEIPFAELQLCLAVSVDVIISADTKSIENVSTH